MAKTYFITYQGRRQSMNAWAKELGIHRNTLTNRILKCDNVEQIFAKGPQRRTAKTPELLTFQGKTQSIKQWSEELGIKLITIYARKRRGMSIEQILAPDYLPNSSITKICYNGQEKTIKEWAETLGLSQHTLRQRLTRMSPEEAINYVPKRAKRVGRLITFNGKSQNMADWAKELGVSRERIRQRLAKWPVERALTLPDRSPRLLTYKGKTMTLPEWAEKLKISVSALHNRLKRYPVEIALDNRKKRQRTRGGGRNRKILTYRGKSQSIREWAKELGLTYASLFGRLKRMSVEEALSFSNQRKRRKKHGKSIPRTIAELRDEGVNTGPYMAR